MTEDAIDIVRVQRILDKLSEVRTRGLSSFGSQSHNFRLNAPLVEAELAAFETEHGIRLPAAYRAFLQHAGNGGAGPYYGIFPLSRWADFSNWVEDECPPDYVSQPCPLYPHLARTSDWREQFRGVSPYQGTIALGSQGCTYEMLLIVTGEFGGRVVYADADGQAPYVVWEPDFLAWYERWLDELLGGYNLFWFGFGPGGGEADFFRILNDPCSPDQLRIEAAEAFCRLPLLSPEGASLLPSNCRDRLSGVRAGACRSIAHFALKDAEPLVAGLVHDQEAVVRDAAARAVMKLSPKAHAREVFAQLQSETDGSAANTQFVVLKDAGALDKSKLLQLLKTCHVRIRSSVIAAITWDAQDVDLLLQLLADSDRQVRRHALTGVRKIKSVAVVPQLVRLLASESDPNVIGSALLALGELGANEAAPVLLKYAQSSDDFHRLDAVDALVRLGDERVIPIAAAMLKEQRPPLRRHATGARSNVHTISHLVRNILSASPNRKLRELT